MSEYWQKLKITIRLMFYHFQCQIDVTAINIGFNIVPKRWPVVIPS